MLYDRCGEKMEKYGGVYRDKYYKEYYEYLSKRMQTERKQEDELKERTIKVVATDTFYLEKHNDRDFLSWFESDKTLDEAEQALEKCLSHRKNKKSDLRAYCRDMRFFKDFLKTQYYHVTKKEIEECDSTENIRGKEKYALTKIRMNQGTIRKNALKKYNGCCTICNMNIENLLIASHIKPWSKSNDEEKGDINNILLLCPVHDALFDDNYISFDDNGNMLISAVIDEDNKKLLNISDDIHIELNDKMKEYMKWHRERLK